MKNFKFCCKNDAKKESISKCQKSDIQEAIEYFAAQKGLSVDSFLEIFKVYQY